MPGLSKKWLNRWWISGVEVTATATEINSVADLSGNYVDLSDTNATITAANSGKTHMIANVAADRTFTLPTGVAGMEYTFVPQNLAAADGHDWIFATTEVMVGGVVFLDTANAISSVGSDGSDDNALQVNVPNAGTRVTFKFDGTNWRVTGQVVAAAAPVFS